jgi:hypothetical protein
VLLLRSNNGAGCFIFSKEGVTQGDPLSMFACGTGILPLIGLLKAEFPAVEQPWHADDAGAGGKFTDVLRRLFLRLQEIGPSFGHHPEPSKSILVVSQHNMEAAARTASPDFNFKVKSGSRCLGGFVGDDAALHDWLSEKAKSWGEAVTDLGEVAPNFP